MGSHYSAGVCKAPYQSDLVKRNDVKRLLKEGDKVSQVTLYNAEITLLVSEICSLNVFT